MLFVIIVNSLLFFILYLVIKGAISNSRMAQDISEIKHILNEFKERLEDEEEKPSLEELEDRIFNRCLRCHRPIQPNDKVCSSCGFELK